LDTQFLGLTFLLYQSHQITYKIFDQIKDLPFNDYPKNIKNALESKETAKFIKRETDKANENGIQIITFNDSAYPSYCKHFKAMPPALYVKGQLPFVDQGVAIVGSRKATSYGIKETIFLVERLVQSGFIIISGLAYGIDSQSHQTCLKNKGTTYAVMGCGLDIDYPLQNRLLKKEIMQTGIVISEFPMGTPPISYNFPVRNRIISALSKCVLVIEATNKSGALITADYALDQGKDVLAVPGNIDQATSHGTNQLIKSGAIIINDLESLDDYLKTTLGFLFTNKNKQKSYSGNCDLEKEMIIILREGTQSSGDLIGRLKYSTGDVLQTISQFEIMGLIRQINGSWTWINN
jgi:DNA processing protein